MSLRRLWGRRVLPGAVGPALRLGRRVPVIATVGLVLGLGGIAVAAPPPPPPPPPSSPAGPAPASAATATAPAEPARPPVERPSPGETPKQKFDRVRLEVQQGSASRIEGAVQNRLPHVKVDRTATPLGIHGVYVGVMPLPGGRTRVLVVTSNARWYSRTLTPAPADPDAEIATTVAELLAAIEAGQVAPDGAETPGLGPGGDAQDGRITGPQGRPDSGWRLGFGLAPEIALGVWPTDIGGVFTGAGGSLEFRARAPRGALLLAGGRVLGNKGAGLGLIRGRAHAIAGYSWRPSSKRMEIDLGGGGTFEMWWVRLDGERLEPSRADQRGAPPLIGALLRLAAAGLFPVGRADVRVGGRLEVAGSAAPDQGVRVPGVVRNGLVRPDEAFRLGGVEVMLGLDFAATWPIPQRRNPPPRVP
jgi:hypothetical protein